MNDNLFNIVIANGPNMMSYGRNQSTANVFQVGDTEIVRKCTNFYLN